MSTQVATTGTPRSDIRSLVQSPKMREQLAAALPSYYTPEQFIVIVRTAINKNPKLQECTPESFMVATITAAQMGIAVDGRNGHLIPRFNKKTGLTEATFQPDYKGLVSVVRKHNPNVDDIYAVLVRENDRIKVTMGLTRNIEHEFDVKKERGGLIGVYAVIQYKEGLASFEYLDRAEVEGIRAHSDSWKSHKAYGYSTPWIDDEGEMWKKSAIKRVIKLADLSEDSVDRLNKDPDIILTSSTPIREIRPASVPSAPEPSNPALPASEETFEVLPSEEAPAKSKVSDTKKPAKKKLTAKEAEPQEAPPEESPGEEPPAAPEEPSLAVRCEAMLQENGFSVPDALAAFQANGWLATTYDPATTPLSVLSEDNLQDFLDPANREAVVMVIKRHMEGKK